METEKPQVDGVERDLGTEIISTRYGLTVSESLGHELTLVASYEPVACNGWTGEGESCPVLDPRDFADRENFALSAAFAMAMHGSVFVVDVNPDWDGDG